MTRVELEIRVAQRTRETYPGEFHRYQGFGFKLESSVFRVGGEYDYSLMLRYPFFGENASGSFTFNS